MTELWSMLLAAVGLSAALCIALAPLARRFGLVDKPSGHKVHTSRVPLVGGIAIYLALVMVIMYGGGPQADVQPLLLACGILMLAGAVDDLRPLNPILRFAVQITACLVMVLLGGIVLTDLGSLLWNGVFSLGWFSIPMTVFAAIGVINAFNMVDGLDGLSSMVFIICALAMALLADLAGHDSNVVLLCIAAAAVFGFSLLNARLPWKQAAQVFLGDSGSMFLGLFLAWQFIDLGNGNDRAFAPMTAVWLFAIPMLDTTCLMRRRWRRGGSPFVADQYHLHHAFLKAGFSVGQTWASIALLVLLTTAIGLAGELLELPEYLMFYAYIAFGLYYYHFMGRCWRERRFLGRPMAGEAMADH